MSEFPMRLQEDEAMPAALRDDLRAALPHASEYDVAAGFARFEALIASGAGGPEDDPGGGGDGAGSDGGSAGSEGEGLDAGGDGGSALLDGGGDVSGTGRLAGGEAGGAGGLAGGAAEMGPIAIPGLSTGGGLLAAKIVAGLAVLGALGAGVVLQNRAPEKPMVVTSAQVRESAPEARATGESATGESGTRTRAQGAQEAPSGQSPGQRAGSGSIAENGAEPGAPGAGRGAATAGTPERVAAGARSGIEGASPTAPEVAVRGAPPSSATSSAAGETPAQEGPTLKDEMEHLATLRQLSRTDPARAAAMAQEGHSRFPKGVFWQEREVLMITALMSSGRGAEARSRGEAFLERHPESPFAETLRRTLGLTP
ncbi:hypothetical protein [Chondromyces apiculatus]|uniref:EBNA-1 protein n=1 Tax=Chondromyces apiculatus DSM 436 TaxID=1192034 RepID=A0A017T7B0_9BACT|nr:hypothetical protein [Chondromyces apiculatus]EYF04892.1 EBNA-1 protein [Chondromyces apiculatus DSM 436]